LEYLIKKLKSFPQNIAKYFCKTPVFRLISKLINV